jgi:chitinase
LIIFILSANRGGEPEDKENFISLIKDLRTAFDKHNYILTAAIGAAAPTIDSAYDVPKMYKYLVSKSNRQ